ncbi:unnamed protein product [Clonostachys rosea]|uniref:Uncharacterized protein n=1 Tax=Bionectria ochroleuca TaxID=29856 RepID=A0ABY6U1F4_BIOOC|nr:unnamed protein product [Clonostachys rosea]
MADIENAPDAENRRSTDNGLAASVPQRYSKGVLLAFVVISIVISVGFGTLAGVSLRSLNTGLGVFGGILGLFSISFGLFVRFRE